MTTQFAEHPRTAARWEHFSHEADTGVRGVGPDMASAFVQAAILNAYSVAQIST